jgi:phosphatidylglycerophosphate synthase
MADFNIDNNEYENVVSINSEDLLTQQNIIDNQWEKNQEQVQLELVQGQQIQAQQIQGQEIHEQEIHEQQNREQTINQENPQNLFSASIPSLQQETINKDNVTDNSDKYGDDILYESWADNNIFFPIANKLVTPMKEVGLTPNMVTLIGTFCRLLSIYYISIDEYHHAAIAYFVGYIFDCVDGKLARKYNMSSKEGMVLDLTADNITNFMLVAFLVYKFGPLQWFVIVIVIMTYILSFSYGMNEAIASQKATNNDNFLARRLTQIGKTNSILDNIFLIITGMTYSSYKRLFPTYDETKINKWLPIMKEFGPGNYNLLVTFIIFNLGTNFTIN